MSARDDIATIVWAYADRVSKADVYRAVDTILSTLNLTEERCDDQGHCTPMRRWVSPWEPIKEDEDE